MEFKIGDILINLKREEYCVVTYTKRDVFTIKYESGGIYNIPVVYSNEFRKLTKLEQALR